MVAQGSKRAKQNKTEATRPFMAQSRKSQSNIFILLERAVISKERGYRPHVLIDEASENF